MNSKTALSAFTALALFTGCAGLERPVTDAALGVGGGYLASELSDGNPAITAIGAGAGVALGEGIHAHKTRAQRKSYADGYNKGRADGIKAIYWDLVEQHRNESQKQ